VLFYAISVAFSRHLTPFSWHFWAFLGRF
jgi:hypothetical protein